MKKSAATFASALTLALLLTTMNSQLAVASETELAIPCNLNLESYLEQRSAYEASSHKDGKSYRSLAILFKESQRELRLCIKNIDSEFKSKLEAIKVKYRALKVDGKSNRLLQDVQRRAEIAEASLRRDEAIRNLPSIPELPARPIRTK